MILLKLEIWIRKFIHLYNSNKLMHEFIDFVQEYCGNYDFNDDQINEVNSFPFKYRILRFAFFIWAQITAKFLLVILTLVVVFFK